MLLDQKFLYSFVINFASRPTYVNLAHFVFIFVLVFVLASLCALILPKTFTSYLLL